MCNLKMGRSRDKLTPLKTRVFGKHHIAGMLLTTSEAKVFKSKCIRNLFIAQDRLDVLFASPEISGAIAQLTIISNET